MRPGAQRVIKAWREGVSIPAIDWYGLKMVSHLGGLVMQVKKKMLHDYETLNFTTILSQTGVRVSGSLFHLHINSTPFI